MQIMRMKITVEALLARLTEKFGGVLRRGQHDQTGECCVLELHADMLGLWTDVPERLRDFDIRPLNDMPVSDAVRTECMLPVLVAYAGSLDWPAARQEAVLGVIITRLVQDIIAELPGLPDTVRQQCRAVDDPVSVEAAALAARLAARERVFRQACTIWLEAATHSEPTASVGY